MVAAPDLDDDRVEAAHEEHEAHDERPERQERKHGERNDDDHGAHSKMAIHVAARAGLRGDTNDALCAAPKGGLVLTPDAELADCPAHMLKHRHLDACAAKTASSAMIVMVAGW